MAPLGTKRCIMIEVGLRRDIGFTYNWHWQPHTNTCLHFASNAAFTLRIISSRKISLTMASSNESPSCPLMSSHSVLDTTSHDAHIQRHMRHETHQYISSNSIPIMGECCATCEVKPVSITSFQCEAAACHAILSMAWAATV